ncbi:MAG: helix-turn-helix domain-containing protein [Candidatus Omnitrophota bacterium]|nr:helix-turn-helix domain-containing protein [Candidatus Omnitrophota bacterium]
MKEPRAKKQSIYELIAAQTEEQHHAESEKASIELHRTVRRLRQAKGFSGVRLCREAGDLDPKTLTALEKGRIKNPSIRTLQSVSRGLSLSVSDLFREAELESESSYYLGSQKGEFQVDFPKRGIKIVSFTPFIRDFFCGKLLLGPRRRLADTLLKHPNPVFVSVLIGRFEVDVETRKATLKEGENLFFNGRLKHVFYNPLHRESVLLMVTAPSFV